MEAKLRSSSWKTWTAATLAFEPSFGKCMYIFSWFIQTSVHYLVWKSESKQSQPNNSKSTPIFLSRRIKQLTEYRSYNLHRCIYRILMRRWLQLLPHILSVSESKVSTTSSLNLLLLWLSNRLWCFLARNFYVHRRSMYSSRETTFNYWMKQAQQRRPLATRWLRFFLSLSLLYIREGLTYVLASSYSTSIGDQTESTTSSSSFRLPDTQAPSIASGLIWLSTQSI